jgi:xanthine dehydrogenase accessory factor
MRAPTALDAARAALDAAAGGPATAVVLAVEGPAVGRRVLLREDGTARGTLGDPALDAAAAELGRRVLAGGPPILEAVPGTEPPTSLYAEAFRPPDELLIVGAGHIAVPLAELGLRLGYRVTVLDDRESFATPDRFPDWASVLRVDFADPFRSVEIGPRTHVVLVTRAHRYDYDCLRRLLESDASPRYIGMIGSRRRVRATFGALLEAGVPRERLARVRAPIGLEIGAETPEEIAVSIAAELILVRRGGGTASRETPTAEGGGRRAHPLAERERVLERLLPDMEGDDG